MTKRIDILPITDSGMREYIVRDDGGFSIRKIPEVLWKYLTESEKTEAELVGLLTDHKRPLLDPYNPQFGGTKGMHDTSTITYKRILSSNGEYMGAEIHSDNGLMYSGYDAPLVAEGMRILSKNMSSHISLSFREEIAEPVKEAAIEANTISFLKVRIGDETLIYEEGYLLFSGANADTAFNNYISSLVARGARFSTREFTYTKEDAPAKYLRDL